MNKRGCGLGLLYMYCNVIGGNENRAEVRIFNYLIEIRTLNLLNEKHEYLPTIPRIAVNCKMA
jgi:hypothetical protein